MTRKKLPPPAPARHEIIEATKADILRRRGWKPWGRVTLKNGNSISWFLNCWWFEGEHFNECYSYLSTIGITACLENWKPKLEVPPDLSLSEVQ